MSHIYEDDEQTKFKFVGEIGLGRLILLAHKITGLSEPLTSLAEHPLVLPNTH